VEQHKTQSFKKPPVQKTWYRPQGHPPSNLASDRAVRLPIWRPIGPSTFYLVFDQAVRHLSRSSAVFEESHPIGPLFIFWEPSPNGSIGQSVVLQESHLIGAFVVLQELRPIGRAVRPSQTSAIQSCRLTSNLAIHRLMWPSAMGAINLNFMNFKFFKIKYNWLKYDPNIFVFYNLLHKSE